MVYEEGRRQTPQAQGAGLELVLVGKYVSFWNDREPEMEQKKNEKKEEGRTEGKMPILALIIGCVRIREKPGRVSKIRTFCLNANDRLTGMLDAFHGPFVSVIA